ncbi:IgA-specific serine endopeptidase autotransporter precursor [Novipirellula galeiformis]|uniref:IgA-specific serine endopeptidase autotransporter n=1 Tax=Novipirellula galeiformis TaxID=2528004 RepID=A0A5C6CP57_9BACT|nr:WD40 repeat domain-containing protein [Novipirellula galeiformis]TWU26232.1 IgA-specific serine endopeptidase autotransporter precursor [Novipirellula galeiformis]
MNKRFVDLVSLTTLLLCLGVSIGHAEDKTDKKADAPEVWVTSIAPLTGDTYVAATADGLLLRDASVKSFTIAAPQTMTDLYTHPAAVWCVDATADGSVVASVDYRGNLVIYDVASKQPTTHEKALERWCQAMQFAPDDKTIVAGNETGKILVWDRGENKVTKSLELDGQAVTAISFSGDGKQIAAADGGGHVHLIEWPELKAAGKIKVSDAPVWSVAYAAGKLMIGSGDRNLYRCEPKADAKPERMTRASDWVTQFVVSKTGKVAAAELGGKLYFPMLNETYDVGSDVTPVKSGVWALCFHDDKTLLVGTRKDGVVAVKESEGWSKPLPPVVDPKPEEEVKPEPTAEEKEKMAATEKAAAEKAAAEKAAAEKMAAEKAAAAKKAAAEKMAAEKAAAEKAAAEKAAAEKAAAEKAAAEKAAAEKAAAEKAAAEKAAAEKAAAEKAAAEEPAKE